MIVIDECHRGSADADSAWRAILDYFSAATHIGLTATPKETKEISSIHYFGEPIYTPPLAEQHRIVAKVDQLFALCDQLKARIHSANQLQLQLTDTLIEQTLA